MREKLSKGLGKKVMGVTLAASLALGTLGTSAFAYKDAWTGKIQQGITLLANQVFPTIQTDIATYGNSKESALNGWVAGVITTTQKQINDFKTAEVKRAKEEIDAHDAENRTKLQKAADDAVQAEKNEQKAKDDASITKEKGDLDAIIDNALNQVK